MKSRCTRLRVRYAETDRMGLLHHANYFVYFEMGRTELLRQRGALVSYNDPYIPALPPMRHYTIQQESQPLTEHWLRTLDCLVIVTDHSVYDFDWIVRHTPLIVDTRNATAECGAEIGQIHKA